MAQTYKTRDGDILDDVVWRYYGALTDAILAAVLDANPGIADHGPRLPAGVAVELPDIAAPAEVTDGVSLWS